MHFISSKELEEKHLRHTRTLFSFEKAIFEMFLWQFLFGHAELSLVLEETERNGEAW